MFKVLALIMLMGSLAEAGTPTYLCSVGITDRKTNVTTWTLPSGEKNEVKVSYGNVILEDKGDALGNRTYGLQLSEHGTAMIMVSKKGAEVPELVAIGSKSFVGLVDNIDLIKGISNGVSIRCHAQ